MASHAGDDLWYIGPSRLMHAKSTDPGNYQPAGPKKPRQMNYARVRAAHGTVWIAAEGQLLRSLDRGASWQITLERNTVFNDVLPLGPRRAITVTSDGTAFAIED
ncbi:MAG: hypothetical protein U0263_00505 [Polyangiaceae bacterium]